MDLSDRHMTAIAPHKAYEMEINNEVFSNNNSGGGNGRLSLDEDSDDIKRVTKHFTWLGEESKCLANFVCSGLKSEGLWTDHGITVKKQGGITIRSFFLQTIINDYTCLQGEVQMVTRDGVLYQNELSEENVLEVSAWMAKGCDDLDQVRCFLWCGPSDQVVPDIEVKPADAEVLEALVSHWISQRM